MRYLTTAAVLALCLLVMAAGWKIVRFAAAQVDAPAGALRAWAETPGVAGDARFASLTRMRDAADLDGARARAADLAALLSVRPLSAPDWLSLAGMRLVLGAPKDEVLAALTMSWLTGPNEGYLMLRRGLFAAAQWPDLPEDARRRTVADLAGAMLGGQFDEPGLRAATQVFSGQKAATRQQIAALVAAEGVPPAQLARFGFETAGRPQR